MKKNFPPAAALPCLLLVVLLGRASRAELPEDPRQLLDLLKAKDARFDKVVVHYIRRGEYTPPPFPYWKFPGQKPDPTPAKPVTFRFKEQMMFRRPETTFVRDVYTKSLLPSDADVTFVSHQKWSDADGLVKEYLESPEHDDRSMRISEGESDPAGVPGTTYVSPERVRATS